jgi:pyridoxamine 5'-phosphate oxidase
MKFNTEPQEQGTCNFSNASATVVTDRELVHIALERVRQSPAAGDYQSPQPPGHIQRVDQTAAAGSEGDKSTHYLAVLNFKVSSIDWLALSQDGHRRARLSSNGDITSLVP